MSPRLAHTIALYGLAVTVWAAGAAVRGRRPSRALAGSLIALELACLIQVALDVIGLLGGHRPRSMATHLGYVAASVAILPLILNARAGEPSGDRWDAAVAAVGALAVSIVVLRLAVTWGARG